MKREFDDLNGLEFELPEGWQVTKDVYSLPNGQGMINKENYLSKSGQVLSFFAVYRQPDDFFAYYDNFLEKIAALSQKVALFGRYNIRMGEYVFPIYVLKGLDTEFYTIQTFINCADCLGCFMATLPHFDGDIKSALKKEKVLSSLIEILRTVQ